MCQPAHLARPITADRRKYTYGGVLRLGSSRTIIRNLAVLAIIFALLSKVKSKDISKTEKLANAARYVNPKDERILPNEVDREEDDGEFQVGYSAYLHSSSSMLAANYKNYTSDRVILPGSDNATFESSEVAKEHQRSKRGVTHLYNMIVCATGCNPLSYKGYGCYCGFLGSGYPMDGIDRCCKIHDWCYDATDCPMFVEYFVPYYWKCYHGYPVCAIEHGEWGSSGSCAQRLCECDRSFAQCLQRYRCPRHKAVCTSSPWRLIQNIFMIV